MSADQYELIDFGAGRKLERFGDVAVDRPAPAAEGAAKSQPALWESAQARYLRNSGKSGVWSPAGALVDGWKLTAAGLCFELKATPTGQVGLFPEQQPNWDWLAFQVVDRCQALNRPLKLLNLFAYTGASTLVCAAAGAEVVHVDAAHGVVAWARRNAELSGLAAAPVRWIVEDAARFVAREIKRGQTYDAVILDPPSYGHGARGEAWKLLDDLPSLLADCRALTAGRFAFLLLTCHTEGVGPSELAELATSTFGGAGRVEAFELQLKDGHNRMLPCGSAVRIVSAK